VVSSEGVFEGGEGAEDECYWMEGKGNRREVGMSVGGRGCWRGVLTVFGSGSDRVVRVHLRLHLNPTAKHSIDYFIHWMDYTTIEY